MNISTYPFTRRQLLIGSAAFLTACAAPPVLRSTPLELLGEIKIPFRKSFAGTTIGGLSAVDYDASTGLFDFLSDDRSDFDPARLYRARIPLNGMIPGPAEFLEVVTLRQSNGQVWPDRKHAIDGIPVPDPEGFRRLPGGTFLWSSEGDFLRGFPPAVYESGADGRVLREFELPGCFAMGQQYGARNNLAFEGIATNAAGTLAWVAMEAPLRQDGPTPTTQSPGAPCRFTLFDVAQGRAIRQIAYQPDAIPFAPVVPGVFADNGVSEVLWAGENELLVLERAYAVGRGNSIRIYRIDTRDASDVLSLDVLAPGNHLSVPKFLVANLADTGLLQIDNIEGMTWGPKLPDGRRTLWFVSDDNFNLIQTTQILAFAFNESV